MATEEVKLPQLGESVTEGIITAWLVEVGEAVEQDQPLFELSTDKVDTEVPSPVAGVLKEQKAAVDDTIEVGDVVAVIDTEGDAADQDEGEKAKQKEEGAEEAADDEEPADDEEGAEERSEAATEAEAPEETAEAAQEQAGERDRGEAPEPEKREAPATPASARPEGGGGEAAVEGETALVSPLVRKLLREAGISPDQVEGTGQGGRITREDAERAIEQGPRERTAEPGTAGRPAPPAPRERERPDPGVKQIDFGGEDEHTEELSRVRRAIARHMHDSLQTTAQLTAVVEVDLTRVMTLRAQHKDDFKQREGVSLSPLPIVARAVCMTIPRHPVVNSRIDLEQDQATFFNFVNLGIAVDTERGLLVPNIKGAQDLTVPALAREIGDLATRARNRKLQPDEISGGTFTITNTGSRGALLDTPIINPPEVAILAATLVEKRPVVVTDELGQDAIAIRWMSYFCLTYDHRMVDGADAARFLADLKYVLETHDFAPELGV